jgi:hypothetical protein
MAGSSGSLESGAVLYSASTSMACDSGDGEGAGFVESSSGGGDSRRQPSAPERRRTAASVRSDRNQNLNFKPS